MLRQVDARSSNSGSKPVLHHLWDLWTYHIDIGVIFDRRINLLAELLNTPFLVQIIILVRLKKRENILAGLSDALASHLGT